MNKIFSHLFGGALIALFMIGIASCKQPATTTNASTATSTATASKEPPTVPVPVLIPTSTIKTTDVAGGGVEIADYTGTEKDIIIPSTVGGKPVVSIKGPNSVGLGAFEYRGLTSVVLPDTLITLGNRAFANNSIASITLPKSLKTIGEYAFQHNSLATLTIPNGVTTIGKFAFHFNLITGRLTLPDSVSTIGEYAFLANPITSLTLGSGVTEIGARAFARSVTFHDSILSSVTITATKPPTINVDGDNSTFTNPIAYLYVPGMSGVSTYQANPWSNYFSAIRAITP